jgi:hypothetical protein
VRLHRIQRGERPYAKVICHDQNRSSGCDSPYIPAHSVASAWPPVRAATHTGRARASQLGTLTPAWSARGELVSQNGQWLSRRGPAGPANASGWDTHRDSMASHVEPRARRARVCACVGSPCLRQCLHGAPIGGRRRPDPAGVDATPHSQGRCRRRRRRRSGGCGVGGGGQPGAGDGARQGERVAF